MSTVLTVPLASAAAFALALLSAVAGFGGGVLLLPVFTVLFGLRVAVPVLTLTQLTSNGSRSPAGFSSPTPRSPRSNASPVKPCTAPATSAAVTKSPMRTVTASSSRRRLGVGSGVRPSRTARSAAGFRPAAATIGRRRVGGQGRAEHAFAHVVSLSPR
ncbi:hypothetical protein [Amycolatopsis sp. cmx-8-4]|uniref:hypothetical protein n=1 Tax=Amycolatopsis sp. cmx-8-4 TaxID=2790947 RepID=UPI00397959E1